MWPSRRTRKGSGCTAHDSIAARALGGVEKLRGVSGLRRAADSLRLRSRPRHELRLVRRACARGHSGRSATRYPANARRRSNHLCRWSDAGGEGRSRGDQLGTDGGSSSGVDRGTPRAAWSSLLPIFTRTSLPQAMHWCWCTMPTPARLGLRSTTGTIWWNLWVTRQNGRSSRDGIGKRSKPGLSFRSSLLTANSGHRTSGATSRRPSE